MIRRLVLLLFVLLVAAGAGAWWMYHRLVTPFQGYAGDEVFVEFPAGTSVSAMAEALAEAGVVRDALTFRVAARMSGQERRLQAGEYRFAGPASSFEVVDKLARGEVYLRPITFREGLTIREMAAHFETMGFGTADAFLEAASRGALVQDLDPDAGNLEGYLFPSTYTLSRSTTAEQLVETMVSTFRAAFTPALRAEAEAAGLSVREVVTLASVVERETGHPEERPMVAAVFLNRLRIGMPLQTDPTVIYGLGTAFDGNLRKRDLQTDGPYNTYTRAGLPPTPISMPGYASLLAVVRPEPSKALYFVSRGDGSSEFSENLADHNRAVNRYQRGR